MKLFELTSNYLYHATFRPLLNEILKYGLGRTDRTNWEDSKPGIVYLAYDPYVAESYAEITDNVPQEWINNIVILKIPFDILDQSKLYDDENVLDDDSTVEYHGIIPISRNMII